MEGNANATGNLFRVGVITSWASLLSLPLGLMAIGGGPCAGPRNAMGSIILLLSGIGGMIAAGYGIWQVFRGFRQSAPVARALGVLSAMAACLTAAIGFFYIWIGVLSLQVYLGM